MQNNMSDVITGVIDVTSNLLLIFGRLQFTSSVIRRFGLQRFSLFWRSGFLSLLRRFNLLRRSGSLSLLW